MTIISELVVRYAADGAQQVVDAENRVRAAISETARQAAANTGVTKEWMERNKTALAAIGVAAGGAMAAIISQTPDLVAGLSETRLYFSMFANEIGQTWAPALDGFNGLLEDALGWFEGLPTPVKDLAGGIAGLGLAILVAIPTIALFVWSLGTISTALAGLSFVTAAGGLTLLGAGVAVVAGLVLGGIVVWALWRTGVLKAVEEAGAYVGQLAYNLGVVFGNIKDNIIEWLGLVAASAGHWGAQFALNWVENIVSNIPFLGDVLAPKINSLKTSLDAAGTELQQHWDEWTTSGGLSDGLTVGWVTPAWANDPSQMQHPVTDWMENLFGGAGPDTSQADRLSQILPEFEMPPGYDDALTRLQDLQQQSRGLDAVAATTSANVSISMATMAANSSTSSQNLTATTAAAADSVTQTFGALVAAAPGWGSDLMGRFVVGLNSQYPALVSAVSRIRSLIESALSFDIAANDRMAERWGGDFVQHFSGGMQQATPAMTVPAPAPAGASALATSTRSGDVYLTIESGAVQIAGSKAETLDEGRLGRIIRDEIAGALRSRGR